MVEFNGRSLTPQVVVYDLILRVIDEAAFDAGLSPEDHSALISAARGRAKDCLTGNREDEPKE